MLDPITSLAFSVHSGKGVYALLLGSGVSRAADIPTGWEVTLDLIHKVAAVQREDCGNDPEGWYQRKFGMPPDYSMLLEQLAITPAERANALAGYFEPSVKDRENGKKQPTAAHKAVARLVSKGYFRVIVTTNFDRLIEQALEAVGIQAVIISSADGAKGAIPLAHSRCTIIKVNGDYRDTRIRNTAKELGAYELDMDQLLDKVFDEYGLIVCGWSGAWDEALRRALLRAPSRRYSMIWAARGTATNEAQQLIAFRDAREVVIDSADGFFVDLESKIDALERLDAPHPLSVAMAVASMKRFLTSDQYRIELHDLVTAESERQIKKLANLPMQPDGLTVSQIFERMQIYERAMEILGSMFAHGCYWGNAEHAKLWVALLERFAELAPTRGGSTHLLTLRLYPVCLLTYLGGLGAVAAGNYETLKELFKAKMRADDQLDDKKIPLILKSVPLVVLENDIAKQMPEVGNQTTPMSEHLFKILRDPLRGLVPSDQQYADLFDRLEYVISLVYLDLRLKLGLWSWAPIGRYRRRWSLNGFGFHKIMEKEQVESGDSWPPLKAGIIESSTRFFELQKSLSEFLQGLFPF